MRLLIAEDDLDLAEALSVLFEKNQFSVDVVNDGLSAYDYASGGDYDAVILDVMMPGLNGLEVLRRLREEGVKTPVMMLTARGEKDDRITGFDAGADDYLPKPFEPDELIARVRAMRRGLHPGRTDLRGRLACHGIGPALLRRAVHPPERAGISGDGAVFAPCARCALRRPDHGARLGLGQRRGDQRRLGTHLEPAQEAARHRLDRDHPRQPRARVRTGKQP